MQAGWPDLYIVHRHLGGMWIELKTGTRVRALQKKRIEDLNDRGVAAIVIRYRKGVIICEDRELQWPVKKSYELIEWLKKYRVDTDWYPP